jgi:hypothetical protein
VSPEQQWWYLDQLKRKRAHLECDQMRVKHLLERATDERTRLRLNQELRTIEVQLTKVSRGVLF